jgi:hypothetical protein
MKNEIADPIWTTPEESWTTRELIGGETVDEQGALRFRPGRVLAAVHENRWLVLDETNRADMDKIFGGLLTWLSGQRVELGRASSALDAPTIELDWHDGPENRVERFDALGKDSKDAGPIRFIVGTEWRLLGTYNALDAQRVFRFGQALGRRFLRVPIPAPSPELFRRALGETAGAVPKELIDAVAALYASHKARSETELGPALFLRIPLYVVAASGESGAKAAASPTLAAAPQAVKLETQPTTATGIPGMLAPIAAEPKPPPYLISSGNDLQLLAEAYLVNVGAWLAKLEPSELNSLGERIVAAKALPREEWNWIVTLLPALG